MPSSRLAVVEVATARLSSTTAYTTSTLPAAAAAVAGFTESLRIPAKHLQVLLFCVCVCVYARTRDGYRTIRDTNYKVRIKYLFWESFQVFKFFCFKRTPHNYFSLVSKLSIHAYELNRTVN